jgi:hypothetical protein
MSEGSVQGEQIAGRSGRDRRVDRVVQVRLGRSDINLSKEKKAR